MSQVRILPGVTYFHLIHYDDVTMSGMASQITSLTIVYPTVYSDAVQRKHQSPASLAFVRGIHWGPVNSPHRRPVTRKLFPFDGVIMLLVVLRSTPQPSTVGAAACACSAFRGLTCINNTSSTECEFVSEKQYLISRIKHIVRACCIECQLIVPKSPSLYFTDIVTINKPILYCCFNIQTVECL